MGLRSDLTNAITAEAQAAAAYTAARTARIAARDAAVQSVQASTGRVPGLIDNDRIDAEMVRLMANGGATRLFTDHRQSGFVDETRRGGDPISTGVADTASAFSTRWASLAEDAGIPDA